MRVRLAKKRDKQKVLEFCKDTFSWGDYIADVWDYWIKDKNLLVGYQNNKPVGVCHASINKKAEQVWIEGIRVHPDFRKKGIATKLVIKSESIAIKNNCKNSFMIVELNNKNSLLLARKLNYKKKEIWYFCSLNPKKSKSSIKLINFKNAILPNLDSNLFTYVKSWRWLPLTKNTIKSLIKSKKILFFDTNSTESTFAVITDSEHFEGTLMVTLYANSATSAKQIFNYVQNYAYRNNYKRIQILSKLKSLSKIKGIKNQLSFYLMAKKI